MTDLPRYIVAIMMNFAPLFSAPVFNHVQTIFLGHVLTNKSRRTLCDILRTVGLAFSNKFSKYHRVFYGAKWNALNGSQILLKLLLRFNSQRELQFVIDSTVERRRGPHIKCIGRKRDPVASSRNNKVLCIGQEWLVTSILIQFPWTIASWACPFLCVLLPPKQPLRSSKNKIDLASTKRHKKLTCWARQVTFQLRRYLGKNVKCSLIVDSAFACYSLAHACVKADIGLITRLRIDARLFDYPIPLKGRGRKRLVGKRIKLSEVLKDKSTKWKRVVAKWYGNKTKTVEYTAGKSLWYAYGLKPVEVHWVLIRDPERQYKPIVLISTDLTHSPIWIIESFVKRWRLETTFEEVRRHLGYETQRHWSDSSVDRITPCIFASFSIICLCGSQLNEQTKLYPQATAWYKKKEITFSDILYAVRQSIFSKRIFSCSEKKPNKRKKDIEEFITLLCAA